MRRKTIIELQTMILKTMVISDKPLQEGVLMTTPSNTAKARHQTIGKRQERERSKQRTIFSSESS
jgi:hypothetical protein